MKKPLEKNAKILHLQVPYLRQHCTLLEVEVIAEWFERLSTVLKINGSKHTLSDACSPSNQY